MNFEVNLLNFEVKLPIIKNCCAEASILHSVELSRHGCELIINAQGCL